MTTGDPIWQEGEGVRPYILAGAEVALRLLLPPRTSSDDPTTWAEVAGSLGYPEPIEAGTSWVELTELSGHGAGPPIEVEHPNGRASESLLNELANALILVTGPRVRWHYEENSDRAGMRVELTFPENGPGTANTYGPATFSGTLPELLKHWDVHGFHGRAWDEPVMVGLAADSYADSIILSGPACLAPVIMDTNLEIFRLPFAAHNPVTTA